MVFKYILDSISASKMSQHTFPAALYIPTQRKTFFTWLRYDTMQILTCIYDHALGNFSTIVEVDDISDIGTDEHYSPAISVLPNGKLICMYGCHNSNPKYKLSQTAYTLDWEVDRRQITRAHTYPQFIAYPNVDSPTKLILFIRHIVGGLGNTWEKYTTTDGITFSGLTEIVRFPLEGDDVQSSPYCFFQQRQGKICMTAMRYHTDNVTYKSWENWHFGYSEDDGTTWKKLNGTSLSVPINHNDCLVVTVGTHTSSPWACIDENNKLVLCFSWWNSGVFGEMYTTGRFYLAQYSAGIGQSGSWTQGYVTNPSAVEYISKGNTLLLKDPITGRPCIWCQDGTQAQFPQGYLGKYLRQAGETFKFEKIYEETEVLLPTAVMPQPVEQNEVTEDPIEMIFHCRTV